MLRKRHIHSYPLDALKLTHQPLLPLPNDAATRGPQQRRADADASGYGDWRVAAGRERGVVEGDLVVAGVAGCEEGLVGYVFVAGWVWLVFVL